MQIKYQTLKGNLMHKASHVHTGFTDGLHFKKYDKNNVYIIMQILIAVFTIKTHDL